MTGSNLQTIQGGWLQFGQRDPFFFQQLENFSYNETTVQMLISGDLSKNRECQGTLYRLYL